MALPEQVRRFPVSIKTAGRAAHVCDELGKSVVGRPIEDCGYYAVAFAPELPISLDVGNECAKSVEPNNVV